jgi:hypothetical protein
MKSKPARNQNHEQKKRQSLTSKLSMHTRQHKRFNNNSGSSNSDKPCANQKPCAGFLKIAPNFENYYSYDYYYY